MLKRALSIIAAAALLCALCVCAFAHEVPDLTRTGTVTLTMKSGETAVSGGNLVAIRVGEVYENDGDYTFRLLGDFAAEGEFPEDLKSAKLAEKLAKIAGDTNATGVEKTIGTDGKVVFDNLELGLYLFVQTEPAAGYFTANPFIMGVPQYIDEAYVYEVDATPKVGVEAEPTTTTTESVPTDPTGPETGQLNWPVPVLSCGGLALIGFGAVLCYNGKKERDEK